MKKILYIIPILLFSCQKDKLPTTKPTGPKIPSTYGTYKPLDSTTNTTKPTITSDTFVFDSVNHIDHVNGAVTKTDVQVKIIRTKTPTTTDTNVVYYSIYINNSFGFAYFSDNPLEVAPNAMVVEELTNKSFVLAYKISGNTWEFYCK